LLSAQVPGSFRAGRAGRFQRGAAGDDLLVHLPGVEVRPAQLDRAEAAAACFGQDPDGVPGQGHRQAFGSAGGAGHEASWFMSACQVADQPHNGQSWVIVLMPSSV
jgi:hypothetical protein